MLGPIAKIKTRLPKRRYLVLTKVCFLKNLLLVTIIYQRETLSIETSLSAVPNLPADISVRLLEKQKFRMTKINHEQCALPEGMTGSYVQSMLWCASRRCTEDQVVHLPC
jgi:hypothetical protein